MLLPHLNERNFTDRVLGLFIHAHSQRLKLHWIFQSSVFCSWGKYTGRIVRKGLLRDARNHSSLFFQKVKECGSIQQRHPARFATASKSEGLPPQEGRTFVGLQSPCCSRTMLA